MIFFAVIKVGTVGIVGQRGEVPASSDESDHRTAEQYAALVLVRPADDSAERYEVFTAKVMGLQFSNIGWFNS